MNIKLTPAQEKLINALKANPDSDAYEHLQAKIISQLYSASKTDKPWVHAKTLLSQSGSVSTRVSAVFHGNRSWDEITYSDHKGYYRLKIPISKTPYPAQMLLEF